MNNLSIEAKQMLHMVLRRLTYQEIRMHIFDRETYLRVCNELDDLEKQLEKDVLDARKEQEG